MAKDINKPSDRSDCIILTSQQISQIWDLYNKGFNRAKIALELNITPWGVRKTIQGKTRGTGKSLKLYHKNNTIPLTYEQEQLILGSNLGDGSILFHHGSWYFSVGHCLEQKEYLQSKANILHSNVLSFIKDKGSYSAGKEYFTTSYYNAYEIERLAKICNTDGVKTVTKEWMSKIDIPAIAYWFMDDGTSTFNKNCVLARFSTLSFKEPEIKLLQNKLLEFNIETTIHSHTDGYKMIIAIRQNSINKFMDLVEPYIVDCMKYKIKRRLNG